MANAFGEAAAGDLQARYVSKVKHVSKCPTKIPLTNAQAHADFAVKEKLSQTLAASEPKQLFKLTRFQNVEPRTSTKRGDQAYMCKGSAAAAAAM